MSALKWEEGSALAATHQTGDKNMENEKATRSGMVYSQHVPAWDQANIVAPAHRNHMDKQPNELRRQENGLGSIRFPAQPPASLFDIQVAREQQMADEGHDRYISRQASQAGAKYDQDGNITGVASYSKANEPHKLIEGVVGHVAQAIQDSLRQAVAGAGAPPLWVKIAKDINNPETLAFIGLSTMMDAVGSQGSLTSGIDSIGFRISKAIEHQAWWAEFLAFDKVMAKRVEAQVTKAHSALRYRQKAIRHIATKEGYKPSTTLASHAKLRKKDRAVIGTFVINSVLSSTDIFQVTTEYVSATKSKRFIDLTPEARQLLEDNDLDARWMSPVYQPMVVPPIPWTTFTDGGYLTDLSAGGDISLVRGATGAQRRAVEADLAAGDPTYVRAVNALQATPLAINGTVVDAVEWCWDEAKMFKKFPAAEAPPRPVLPDDYEGLSDKVKSQHRAGLRKWHLKRREVVANRHCMNSDLKTARDMQSYDQFYTPWNMDFRGRMYMLSTFNYHRADHIKAMFQFARGKAVTDPKWIKVHLANCGDFDKISKKSFEDRVAWVDDNHDQLIACAKDFKASFGDWSRADKPFQFLAAVVAYKEYCDHGAGYVCHLPPSLDGTNSGTQHYAAATLNAVDGYLVNLVPDDACQDVYAVVAKAVEERVKQDLTSDKTLPYALKLDRDGKVIERGYTPTLGDLARLWLDFGITRTVTKRATMTYGYSSNQNGMYDQLMEDFMVPLERKAAYREIKKHPFGDDHVQRDAARYLANIQYETIRKTLKSVSGAMDYLRGLSEALSKENKVMRSTSASGFPVFQRYQKTKRMRVRVFLWDREAKVFKRSQITMVEDKHDQIDSRKASNAVSPNLIHAADAAHMALTICAMLDKGINDFFMIHDSFATQAADTDTMYQVVRQVFVDIYGGCCFFERLETEVREQLANADAKLKTPMPAKGDLDINGVLESRYCFS